MEFVNKIGLVSRQTDFKLFSWVTFSQNDLGEWRGRCIISYVCIYCNVLRSIPDLKYSKNCIAFFVLVSCRILNLLYFVEQLYIFPISHKHHSDSQFIPMLQLHDVPFWRYSQTAMQVRNIRKIMCPNSLYSKVNKLIYFCKVPPKGRPRMSDVFPLCMESQGCHLIPLSYLLSGFSARSILLTFFLRKFSNIFC